MVEIVIDEDGRVHGPVEVRLRLSAVEVEYPLPPPDRQERPEALWKRIEEDDTPLQPWPENDPVVNKYRRKGLIG